MGIPILKYSDSLFVSIQEELDDEKVVTLQQDILRDIQRHSAARVILDVSALDIIDSYSAKVFSESVQMAELMGAKVVLTGVQPAVAITLHEMGISMQHIKTALDIESGLEALKKMENEIKFER
ncbi:anti-sigma-factor antagonist [Fictibacillus macauensis ZFHKF-1]|uniref:Anti-sigma-factor antagonist n=1 Tax=Fictibacillus macauensis ZFHKF-1 TaxID=1196324 RepID=I8UIM6_9BACL|nr:STAS domain-containing protein [Fictibacillus macauensis]EIT86750.1 anti-sigma-factor antagonist [Fictibacillus macauensis ZFHKF-1]